MNADPSLSVSTGSGTGVFQKLNSKSFPDEPAGPSGIPRPDPGRMINASMMRLFSFLSAASRREKPVLPLFHGTFPFSPAQGANEYEYNDTRFELPRPEMAGSFGFADGASSAASRCAGSQ